jgi:hypothetical protein
MLERIKFGMKFQIWKVKYDPIKIDQKFIRNIIKDDQNVQKLITLKLGYENDLHHQRFKIV